MSGTIAIIVPAYHCETTIPETLRSIQEQGPSLDKIREVMVADDGSRDRTAEIARSVWRARTPLRILEREFNCGEYASVNNAVEQLPDGTEWFIVLHADDIATPGWLDAFLVHIERAADNIGSICSSYDCFDDRGTISAGENDKSARVVTVGGTREAVADSLTRGCWWHISGCALRTATYREVGGLPKVMQQKGDWDLLLRILAAGWTIEYIPRTLMCYRNHPASSSSLSFRRHTDIWETMLVVARFRWALSASALARIHTRHILYLLRRIVRALVALDVARALWVLPALGCVFVSYWTCVLDGTKHEESKCPNRLLIQG
jgi:glycosyltransferase involved in cell wall biosynthesis